MTELVPINEIRIKEIGTRIREKTIKCSRSYKEVDIFSITERAYKRGRRKKTGSSREAQIRINEKNSKRLLVQLVNANFTKDDYFLTLTHDDDHIPESVEEAERELDNFLRRIAASLKRKGFPPMIYIAATQHIDEETGEEIRPHHHLIISCALGIDAVIGEWSRIERKKRMERLGLVTASPLHKEKDGALRLSRYIHKRRNYRRRWRQSRNLKRPNPPKRNDDRYTRRDIEKIMFSGEVYNPDFWMKKYRNWNVADVVAEYNDYTGWHITLRLWKRDRERDW